MSDSSPSQHRKNFPRKGLDNNRARACRLEFLDTVLQGLLDNFLHVAVDGEDKVQARFRLRHFLGTAVNFTPLHIAHAHADSFDPAQRGVEHLFHAHVAAAIEIELSDNLACQVPLQEYAAIIVDTLRCIAIVVRKNNTVPVHDATAARIHVMRTRHAILRLGLVNFAVEDLDIERLPHQHADKAHHDPLEEGQRFQFHPSVHRNLPHPSPSREYR